VSDHPAAGEATGGLVPSGVHTARRQAGKWVGALTNPPQMREHPEGAPASPPPPANTQSRTQPEAQASRGGGGRGEQLKRGTLSTLPMPSATATQDPGDACRRTPLQHSLRLPTKHPSCSRTGPLVAYMNLLTWQPLLRADIKWSSRSCQTNRAGGAL